MSNPPINGAAVDVAATDVAATNVAAINVAATNVAAAQAAAARFARKMAWRELRRSWKRFAFFLALIALGVGALVGVKGFSENLTNQLNHEARSLLAADLRLSMQRQPTPEDLALITALEQQGATLGHVTETLSMAVAGGGQTQLIQLKAVQPDRYPFYGTLELSPAVPLADLLRGDGTVVAPEVLTRLNLQVGDTIKLGTKRFTIRGTVVKEPDAVTQGFALGPRIFLSQDEIQGTGLLAEGARATQRYLIKLPAQGVTAQQVKDTLAPLKQKGASLTDASGSSPAIGNSLARMTSFLVLVAMISLLVGGVGVAGAIYSFIQRRLDTIAVLRCLGATGGTVRNIYLTLTMALGIVGSLLGVLLGYGVQFALPLVIGPLLKIDLHVTLAPAAALQGLGVGVLVTLLFTLLPLLSIEQIRPLLIFRRDMAENRQLPRRIQWTVGTLITVALGLIAAWQAQSLVAGFWFLGGLLLAGLVLAAAGWAVLKLLRWLPRPKRYWLRHGVANLYRPGGQTLPITVALGIGVTVVLTVLLLQQGILHQVRATAPGGSPNLFFLNVQAPDVPKLQATLQAQPGVVQVPAPVPIVVGRVVSVHGTPVDQLTTLDKESSRWLKQERQFTWYDQMPPGTELKAGRWWTPAEAQTQNYVSVDVGAAKDLTLNVGDEVTVDITGQQVSATVASLRQTTDFRAGGGFTFVFSPKALVGMPTQYLMLANVTPAAVEAVERAVVVAAPAVSVINLSQTLDTVQTVLDRIGLVVRFIGGFSILAGLIILASSVSATKYRRSRESALLKTLGASRATVAKVLATEYALLGAVAGVVGGALATGATFALLKYALDAPLYIDVPALVGGIVFTGVLTLAVGLGAAWDVLQAKPLAVLRSE